MIGAIGAINSRGGIDQEYQKIMYELGTLKLQPTGDKGVDKARLEANYREAKNEIEHSGLSAAEKKEAAPVEKKVENVEKTVEYFLVERLNMNSVRRLSQNFTTQII